MTLQEQVAELAKRTKKTIMSRYRASERLERHHKLSQWTVSFLSVALVFIPLMQAYEVNIGIDAIYLSATQAFLAVLVLAYSLLLGQENFISRSEAMHRNGIELGRFLRTLQPQTTNTSISISQYNDFVKQYYDILDKYENHKPIDFLYTRLHFKPEKLTDWPLYCWIWLKARLLSFLSFSHYLVVLSFVIFLFFSMFSSIYETSKKSSPLQPSDFVSSLHLEENTAPKNNKNQ